MIEKTNKIKNCSNCKKAITVEEWDSFGGRCYHCDEFIAGVE